MALARSPSVSSRACFASSVLLPVWSATSLMSSSGNSSFCLVFFSVTCPVTWKIFCPWRSRTATSGFSTMISFVFVRMMTSSTLGIPSMLRPMRCIILFASRGLTLLLTIVVFLFYYTVFVSFLTSSAVPFRTCTATPFLKVFISFPVSNAFPTARILLFLFMMMTSSWGRISSSASVTCLAKALLPLVTKGSASFSILIHSR